MLPLKGRYVICDKNVSDRYKMIVYPVPIKGAFNLGVHSTMTMDGRIKFGPTVFPAFSEANYDYLDGVNIQGLIKALHAYTYVLRSPHERHRVG